VTLEACSSDHAILVQEVLFLSHCLQVLKLSCSSSMITCLSDSKVAGYFGAACIFRRPSQRICRCEDHALIIIFSSMDSFEGHFARRSPFSICAWQVLFFHFCLVAIDP
jgi:hypothetical protein